jgi:hypothetical protein
VFLSATFHLRSHQPVRFIERRAKASDRATHRDFVTYKNPSPLIEISICTLKDGVL